MKNTNIAKIRHILESILLIYGGNNHQLGEWTKEALALRDLQRKENYFCTKRYNWNVCYYSLSRLPILTLDTFS